MTNLKKGLFELHIIGDPSKKKVLLIHGMGFQWKFCFKKVIEELKRNYCLILPELGGHNMQGLGGFSNVYECTRILLMRYLNENSIVFLTHELGKTYHKKVFGKQSINFNISHSGEIVLLM